MALTVNTLRDRVAHHIQDPSHSLVNRDQLLAFLNSAAQDVSNEGWLLPTQDESLTIGSADYEYDVPSGLVYIHEIWQESATGAGTYPTFVPWHQWEIVVDASSTPAIHFSRDSYTITASIDLRLKGHTRPTTLYADGDTLDTGMESFLRERTIEYAARYMARHGGAHAQMAAQLSQEAHVISESLLQQQGEFFRPKRYSRVVPGR